jgi:hypothetical protein
MCCLHVRKGLHVTLTLRDYFSYITGRSCGNVARLSQPLICKSNQRFYSEFQTQRSYLGHSSDQIVLLCSSAHSTLAIMRTECKDKQNENVTDSKQQALPETCAVHLGPTATCSNSPDSLFTALHWGM